MEEQIVKKRGRKPKSKTEEEVTIKKEDNVPKKRGRKKKWEITEMTTSNIVNDNINFNMQQKEEFVIGKDYVTNSLKFGNLNIKLHEVENTKELVFEEEKNNNTECLLEVSSDEELPIIKDNFKTKKIKNLNLYTTNSKQESNIRCFNCHHHFDGKQFYLPIDYDQKLDRYKIFGNFCSPNCVKSYAFDNPLKINKPHLVGQFYRKLFGTDFRITSSPHILKLKEYGGDMTIEEYRKCLYKNDRYILSNINSKIVAIT
tara:strand:+ start:5796 stop:6569 length:774 start_codon:yes stop_codon:yes gene_type:complete